MFYLTDTKDEAIDPRLPLPVDDCGAQATVTQSETLTYNGKAAASAISINSTSYRNIFNPEGDQIGSYWGNPDNFVYGSHEPSTGRPITGHDAVSIVETNGSAVCVINDKDNNLELMFESLTGTVKRFILKVTDTAGAELYGWVMGVAASGNIYTFDIFNDRLGEGSQNWVGTLASFNTLAKVEIYRYQNSVVFGTGTTFTEEVAAPKEYTKDWRHVIESTQRLSAGQYFIDYMRGRLIGKRADNTASETITYTVEASAAVSITTSGGTQDTVQGTVAHSGVDSGNPVSIGGIAQSAQQTAVTAADRVKAVFNLFGELVLAGYTWATNSLRIEEIDPIDEHYSEKEQVDDTDLSAATRYYPSSTGKAMGNFNNMSIQLLISGGVTMTVEAKNDDSTDWVDITKSGTNMNLNTASHASYADMGTIVNFTNLRVRNVRIKSVTSDATNGVQYHVKYTAL